jgi:hypothetical protein
MPRTKTARKDFSNCRLPLNFNKVEPIKARNATRSRLATSDKRPVQWLMHAEDFCRRRRPRNDSWNMRQRRREATANCPNSPKAPRREGYVTTVQIDPVIIYSSSLKFLSCLLFSASRSSNCNAQRAARRGFVPQAQAALQRLIDAPAPPRSYSQRPELAEYTSP